MALQRQKFMNNLRTYKRLPKVTKRSRNNPINGGGENIPPPYLASTKSLRWNQSSRKRDFIAWEAHHARRFANHKSTEYKDGDELYPAPSSSYGIQSPRRMHGKHDRNSRKYGRF